MSIVPTQIESKNLSLQLNSFLNKSMDIYLSEDRGPNLYLQFHNELSVFYKHCTQSETKKQFYQKCNEHPISKLFDKEPITVRSKTQPRGYAGDAELIDFIYRLKSPDPSTSFIGRELYSSILESTVCQSVRWRAKHLAEKIEEKHQYKKAPINAFAIASGHLRELHYVEHLTTKIDSFYALDQDPLSTEEAQRSLPGIKINFFTESIISIIKKSIHIDKPLDFIYSAGLFDYLNDKLASKLLASAFNLLVPGGSLLVANFAPGLKEQAYMEAFMDWHLIYRDETEMVGLLKDIPNGEIDTVDMYRDPMGNVVYMEVRRM